MHLARHQRWILLCALVVVAAAAGALVGCTMVTDSTTGVSLDRANPSVCLKACAQSHGDLVRAEADYHQAQVEACEALPEAEREDCLEAEATRHQAVMHQIAGGRQDCMNDCHRQGGGIGG